MLGKILDVHEQNMIVLTRFQLKSHVVEEDVVFAADVLSNEFYCQRDGFLKRELVANDKDEFVDILYWRSSRHSIQASLEQNLCAAYANYVGLIQLIDSSVGSGHASYRVLRTWLAPIGDRKGNHSSEPSGLWSSNKDSRGGSRSRLNML